MTVKSFWAKNGINIANVLSGRTLPPYIYFLAGRYEVLRKEGKRIKYIGRFDTLQEAKMANRSIP